MGYVASLTIWFGPGRAVPARGSREVVSDTSHRCCVPSFPQGNSHRGQVEAWGLRSPLTQRSTPHVQDGDIWNLQGLASCVIKVTLIPHWLSKYSAVAGWFECARKTMIFLPLFPHIQNRNGENDLHDGFRRLWGYRPPYILSIIRAARGSGAQYTLPCRVPGIPPHMIPLRLGFQKFSTSCHIIGPKPGAS